MTHNTAMDRQSSESTDGAEGASTEPEAASDDAEKAERSDPAPDSEKPAPPPAATEQKSDKKRRKVRRTRKSSWRRRLLIAGGSLPVLALVGWFAVHNIPGFGPLVADSLRAVFGKKFVAWLEDTAYDIQDWLLRKTRKGEAPKSAWKVPASATVRAGPPPTSSSADAPPPPPPFVLANLPQMHKGLASEGEGVWVPMVDPRKPEDRTRLLKTFVHSDKNRSWSITLIIAVDLAHVDLHSVVGRYEPVSRTKEAKEYKRTAVIPPKHYDLLLAAFNGGYKATHGYYGMKIDGVVIAPPRGLACTIAKYQHGSFGIRPWEKIKDTVDKMVWFRQTPICMYDAGVPHPALSMPKLGWGASTVSRTTVIRRSAIGLDKTGKVLFVGMGNFTTGKSIAEAMHHAGAHDIAQLDVNFSFPKFLTYKYKEPGSKELQAIPLTKNFEFTEDQYIGTRSHRDFFYLVRKKPSGS